MVVIPAGRFLMGSPPDEPERTDAEGPQHEVHIAKPFAMGVYAVTFDEYDRFCDSTKRQKPDDQGLGPGQAAGHQRLVARRARLLHVAHRTDRAPLSAAERSGMGIRLPGRHHDAVPFRRSHLDRAGELRRQLPLQRLGEGRVPRQDHAGRLVPAQRLRPARHARQRLGVVPGCVARELRRRAHGWFGLGRRR